MFLKKYKWYKKLIRKLYENAHPYKTPVKWTLSYNGFQISILDLSHLGDFDHIKIIEGNSFEGRNFSYMMENDRQLTVQYILNEYSYLPEPIKVRMAEILKNHLDISDEPMDKLIEKTKYFFGTEEL
jgi:hypothetical protein